MSPLLGGHLHLARDSHIGEDEEITPLVRLAKGADLGDFVRATGSTHCLRRRVTPNSLLLDVANVARAAAYPAASRSQSPGALLRPGSPRAQLSPRLSQRAPRAGAVGARPSQSPHFWQPWSAREVKSPSGPAASPRIEAKHSPGRGASTTLRGRSPRSPTTAGHSPKSSPSPDTSRSPSAAPRRPMARRSRGLGSPRAASPFNPHTDYDIHVELPSTWHRLETRVGVADESRWPSNARAKFLLIDEDDKTLLWESSETLELWAPTELCSVILTTSDRSSPRTKHLCLRVRCSSVPDGALWIEPVLTCRSRSGSRCGSVSAGELLAGEMLMELVSRLSCRDVARLLVTSKQSHQLQQSAWHMAFAHSFRQAYLRYFLSTLRKPAALNGTAPGIQWLGGASTGTTFTPLLASPRPAPRAAGAPTVLRRLGAVAPRNGRLTKDVKSCRRAVDSDRLPQWAAEVFDWRQICRRFYLAQLPYANVNFQLFNCSTPNGFVKDSGETLHVPRAYHGQSPNFRCGWNIPLPAVHFQSQPSSLVVAHRSPLGVAGVPPSVATVRGTAGPEPLAMTPVVSEKDSAVLLPMALPGQLKLQWTLEVDPGRYLVVVTVGDRHVGFAANLEVAGLPIFSGEWVEAGSFKSRCLICETKYGAITLGQPTSRAWSAGLHKDDVMCHLASRLATASDGLLETLAAPGSSTASDPPQHAHAPRATDALAKGTRLVSIRTAAVSLAREVEKERQASFTEFNGKISEARQRVDALRQVCEERSATSTGSGATSVERELHRATAKLAELQAQKALKLFCLIGSSRRVTHPYVYLTPGEPAANVQLGQAP